MKNNTAIFFIITWFELFLVKNNELHKIIKIYD